jgi:hypothetical protein
MLGIELVYFDSTTTKLAMKCGFDELNWSEFCGLYDNSKIEDANERLVANIALLTSHEDIHLIPVQELIPIRPLLNFIDDVKEIIVKAVPEEIKKIQVANMPWKLLEASKQAIQLKGEENSFNKAMPEIVKIYSGIDISKMPFTESFPIANYFKEQLESFSKQFSKLNEYEPKPEQVLAGIEELNQYGMFTTLHALCGGDPLKYESMLDKPAIEIYQTLLYDYELSLYNQRLEEINKRNK